MIVAECLWPSFAGAAGGLLAAWWATQVLRAFLYEIDPHEPAVWAGSVATLFVVIGFAAWLPAHRAAAGDPMLALRAE